MVGPSSASSSSNIRARDQETGRRRRQAWSSAEDQVLIEALRAAKEAAGVQHHDDTASADPETISHISWAMVASKLPGRTAKDCRKRLVYSLDVNLRKGAWTEVEDQLLLDAMSAYVNLRNGDMNKIKWSAIARAIGTRSGDQASKRWREVLNPALNRSEWSQDEDARLIALIDSHRSEQPALSDWTFPAPSSSSSSSSSVPGDSPNVRLNCSWNEIAKQHGTRTALQVRNRFMLIKQLKNGGIPASISRLGPVRQNMYRTKLSSFSSRASTSSSGASDDGNSPSFLRKSSSRPRASSTRSAPQAASYDERGGIHPSLDLAGTSSSWQSPSLFTTPGLEGSPAHWNAMQQPTWAPSGLAAPTTVSPESLSTVDHQPPAFTLPPSFFGPGHSTANSFPASAPASLDSLTSAWPASAPLTTAAAAPAAPAAMPTEMSFCHPLFGMLPAMDSASPWSHGSSVDAPASTSSASSQHQHQQPSSVMTSFDSAEPRSVDANEFAGGAAPAHHTAKINIFGGAFVL